MQKIVTCLWFDYNAEEAIEFYLSIFRDSKVLDVARYPESGPGKPGAVMTITFELEGQRFMAINGGPQFPFTHAISLMVNCETQEEIDTLWNKLSAGGSTEQCGWLKDKYGLSWQIVPNILSQLMQDKNPGKVDSVMKAILEMVKLDIAELRKAYERG